MSVRLYVRPYVRTYVRTYVHIKLNAATKQIAEFVRVDETFATIWLSRSSEVMVKVRRSPQSPFGTIFSLYFLNRSTFDLESLCVHGLWLEMTGNGFLHSHSLPFPCNQFPFLPIPIPIFVTNFHSHGIPIRLFPFLPIPIPKHYIVAALTILGLPKTQV